jgi:hypothetical protein
MRACIIGRAQYEQTQPGITVDLYAYPCIYTNFYIQAFVRKRKIFGMHACVHVHTCVCMYAWIRVQTLFLPFREKSLYVCMCVCMYSYIAIIFTVSEKFHGCMYVCMYLFIHGSHFYRLREGAWMYVCVYVFIHTWFSFLPFRKKSLDVFLASLISCVHISLSRGSDKSS